jgi:hypothetical protein
MLCKKDVGNPDFQRTQYPIRLGVNEKKRHIRW